MSWEQETYQVIQNSGCSSCKTLDSGSVKIRKRKKFSGLSSASQAELVAIAAREQEARFRRSSGGFVSTLQDAVEKSSGYGMILNNITGDGNAVQKVMDSIGYRDVWNNYSGQTGVRNTGWLTGVNGKDNALNSILSRNMWISPIEAATIYGNGGLPKYIIDRKSMTLLNNGVYIKNTKLTQKELELVAEDAKKTGFGKAISDSVKNSLIYSGAILMPIFNYDTPITMSLGVKQLVQYGIIGQGCIDRWCMLDRWNTVYLPDWNPISPHFIKPEYFFIPFLGSEVHSSRIAKVMTAPQPGYWGMINNMGWGVSDIPAWIQSELNYETVIGAIPTMIQQMSLLVRTFNVDGPLAMEGALMLDQVNDINSVKIREANAFNPINMDIIGKLEAIQRDFAQVPELVRLLRQDLAAKAGALEQSFFTVEQKGLGGSDNKSQNSWMRAEETNRFMYSEIQEQIKQLAKIQIINALGVSDSILKALPYTEVVFTEQEIADLEDRAAVLEAGTRGLFDTAATGFPLDSSADLVADMSGNLIKINSKLREKLAARQKLIDQRDQEKHDAEMALLKAQASSTLMRDSSSASSSSSSSSSDKEKKGHSYDDPMEQRKHEKVSHGGTKKQGLAKQRNKVQGS